MDIKLKILWNYFYERFISNFYDFCTILFHWCVKITEPRISYWYLNDRSCSFPLEQLLRKNKKTTWNRWLLVFFIFLVFIDLRTLLASSSPEVPCFSCFCTFDLWSHWLRHCAAIRDPTGGFILDVCIALLLSMPLGNPLSPGRGKRAQPSAFFPCLDSESLARPSPLT